MPKYVIEREIPNAVKLSAGDLQGIAQKSDHPVGPKLRPPGGLQ